MLSHLSSFDNFYHQFVPRSCLTFYKDLNSTCFTKMVFLKSFLKRVSMIKVYDPGNRKFVKVDVDNDMVMVEKSLNITI